MIGIYAIKNNVTEAMYIGQSNDIDFRIKEHFRDLKKNRHYNKHLQRSYDKYGEDCFEVKIMEQCTLDQLPMKEQYWLDQFDRSNLYNHVFDVQHRQGKSNPNYGNKNSLEVRKKMTINRSNLTEQQILDIVSMLKQGIKHSSIAENIGVLRTTVTRISNGTRFSNITGGPIVPVIYENGIRKLNQTHKNHIGKSHLGMKYKIKEKS